MATQYWYPLTRFEWHGKAFVASLQASQAPLAGKKIWRFHCCQGDQRCFNLWGPTKIPPKKGQLHNYQLLLLVFVVVFFFFRFLRCHGTRMGSGTQFTVVGWSWSNSNSQTFVLEKNGLRSEESGAFWHCTVTTWSVEKLLWGSAFMWETGSKSSWQQEPGIHLELEV